jgi:excisionase family DNA binding protein
VNSRTSGGRRRVANTGASAVAPEPLLVGLPQLSTLTALSRRTLKRMAAEGSIPGVVRPRGRLLRFQYGVVKEWVEAGCPRQKPTGRIPIRRP